jgi:hypothetical protein
LDRRSPSDEGYTIGKSAATTVPLDAPNQSFGLVSDGFDSMRELELVELSENRWKENDPKVSQAGITPLLETGIPEECVRVGDQ